MGLRGDALSVRDAMRQNLWRAVRDLMRNRAMTAALLTRRIVTLSPIRDARSRLRSRVTALAAMLIADDHAFLIEREDVK